MTSETEAVTTEENMTKKEMAKVIKTAKREAESPEKESTISISDVMKDKTSEVIQKVESKVPTYTELYTDLCIKYLHTTDDLYGAWYLSQKGFFGNLGTDKPALQAFDSYWKFITNMTTSQIEMAANFAKMYVQSRLATIDSYDKVANLMIDSYARAWNQFQSNIKKVPEVGPSEKI
ncbi:MAG: hypothetical protein ACREA3_07900 [Nitrosotalea sp.]